MTRWFLCLTFMAVSAGTAAADSGPRTLRVGSGEGGAGAALVAALAAAASGDTVLLAAGDYEITAPLRPRSGVRLLGAGQGRTTLRYRGERPGSFAALDRAEDVEIGEMTLDGEGNPLVHQGILTTAPELGPVASETWRDLIKRVWEVDPLLCPQCGGVYPHAIHIRRLCALARAFGRDKGLDTHRRQVIIAP